MADTLARRLKAGETVYTGWCGLPYPLVTEILAREGFAAVTIDGQHGLWDTASIVAAVAAVRQGGAAPVVRVPVGGFASISRALDFGAEGIIAPMINTQEDARAFAAFAKFPPVGERSWGPHRAMMLGGFTDQQVYLAEANSLTVTLAMIETRTALANIDAIAATPGWTDCFSGPPISRSRCRTDARSTRSRRTSTARSIASSPRPRKPGRFPAPIATTPSAPPRSPGAACASSRWRAT